jgi:hypothetical protein
VKRPLLSGVNAIITDIRAKKIAIEEYGKSLKQFIAIIGQSEGT